MNDLMLQEQPTPYACVHTCIAIVLGIDPIAVLDKYPNNKQGLSVFQMLKVLDEYGIHHAHLSIPKLWHGWQIVSVPSRNMAGGLHCVLVYWDKYTGNIRVIDPSRGEKYNEDGSNLISISDVVLIQMPE